MPATAEGQRLRELRFRAMGTDVHLAIVGGDPGLLHRGEARVRELEQRWSRFVRSSELNELNGSAGHLVPVSPDTFELVQRAVQAWRCTGGRFDPTVGATLAAHGYDRTFSEVLAAGPTAIRADVAPSPGLAGVVLVPELHAVALPAGTALDAGGIGKGLAADLTAALLVADGADGALVNLGGDLRAVGRPPAPEGWSISVPDPLEPGRELLRLALPDGAVATSSRLQRAWATTSGPAHHLIDPATGRPAITDVVAVTVVAAEAWWAEAVTKALFLTGAPGLDELEDVHAVVVTEDGTRHATAGLRATLR